MGVQFTVTIDILSCRRSLKFTCFCACVGVEPRWNALEQAVLGALCRAGWQSHLSGAHNLDDDIPKEYTHALLQKPTLPACYKALTYQSTNDENNISWSNISFHNHPCLYDLQSWMCACLITPRKKVTPHKLLISSTYIMGVGEQGSCDYVNMREDIGRDIRQD